MENSTGGGNQPAQKSGIGMGTFIAIGVTLIVLGIGTYYGYNHFKKKDDKSPESKPDADNNTKPLPESQSQTNKPAREQPSAMDLLNKTQAQSNANAAAGSGTDGVKSSNTGVNGGGAMGGNAASLGLSRGTIIKNGVRGEAAKAAQKALNQMGAMLVADGIFGTKSVQALNMLLKKQQATLGEIADAAKKKGINDVFGIQLY